MFYLDKLRHESEMTYPEEDMIKRMLAAFNHISTGMTVNQACAQDDVSLHRSTFFATLNDVRYNDKSTPERCFSDLYFQAQKKGLMAEIDEMKEIADNMNVDASQKGHMLHIRRWKLERLDKRFAATHKHENKDTTHREPVPIDFEEAERMGLTFSDDLKQQLIKEGKAIEPAEIEEIE